MIIKDGNLLDWIVILLLNGYLQEKFHMLKSSDTIMNYTFTDLNGFIYFI